MIYFIYICRKNNVRTNSKENTSRLLITLKIQVDGLDDSQDDKNNEHNCMKNVCSFFWLLWPLGLTATKWNINNFKGAYKYKLILKN